MPAELVRQKYFLPHTLDERLRYAKELSEAGLLPGSYRRQPANLLIAMDYAESLEIPLVQALGAINVIDGKPSASAGLISALVRRAGHRLRVRSNGTSATATIIRHDDPDYEYVVTWDLARAERAGLVKLKDGKPFARSSSGKILPWEAYTEELLKARAVTGVARDACQEALMGIHYTPEELGAIVNEDGTPVEDPTAGKAARRDQPVTVTTVPAAEEPVTVLPDDFPLIVQEAEEAHDRDMLRDLYSHAVKAKNPEAVALALAAGKRVAEYLAAHPEDTPKPEAEEDVQDAVLVNPDGSPVEGPEAGDAK